MSVFWILQLADYIYRKKKGTMEFLTKHECVICGIEHAKKILTNLELEYKCFVKDGDRVSKDTLLI